MLQQNWAMLAEACTADSSAHTGASILFFDDHGLVFDEVVYANAAQAEHALAFNGFTPLSEQPGFRTVAGSPQFPLRRGNRFERPVYSSGEYWQQPPGLDRVTQRRTMTPAGLERFVEAQATVIDTAMEELRAGRKETHWMWFVFPQLYGLGRSRKAQKYGIVDLHEARLYLEHPLLGHRLHECFRLVLQHPDRRADDIFGTVDAMKFRSCATLFDRASATPNSVFHSALKHFYGGKADLETVRLL
ncbi:DUF1810 domain-containing protein [Extensimonas perlucida]|uniref:DUF1810 domain-containing protein n=1 Tax=Extensimonas perlucida TaxID=2590786 RepID=UPI00319E44A3